MRLPERILGELAARSTTLVFVVHDGDACPNTKPDTSTDAYANAGAEHFTYASSDRGAHASTHSSAHSCPQPEADVVTDDCTHPCTEHIAYSSADCESDSAAN